MADSGDSDDPFRWSNERLIKELCSSDRTWEAPPPKKWPDPTQLEAMLKEHELDGEDLITYADMMGSGAYDSLFRDLDIKKIPHKASFRRAIQLFQARSPAYREWKGAQTEKPDRSLDDEIKEETASVTVAAVTADTARTASARITNEAATPAIQKNAVSAASTVSHAGNPSSPIASSSANTPNQSPQTTPNSRKRKRITPTNISSVSQPRKRRDPVGANNGSFFDESAAADDSWNLDSLERLWQDSSKDAYLGHWKLSEDALLQGPDPLKITDDDDSEEKRDFGWGIPQSIPAGRRLQVHRIMRRHLYSKKPGHGWGHFTRLPGGSNAADEEDYVLPALGESDDEGYDTETWNAMEMEAKERNNPEPQKETHLPMDVVSGIITENVCRMEEEWAKRKMPKLQSRENALWNAARRSGSRKAEASQSRARAEELSRRIEKLTHEIRSLEWKNAGDVRQQTAILEASIEDRQHALWMAKVLASPSEPPKRAINRRSVVRTQAARKIRAQLAGDGEETLTSSSEEDEDDLNDFVVDEDDDDDSRGVDGGSFQDVGEHVPSGDPMEIDARDLPATLSKTGQTIDEDDCGIVDLTVSPRKRPRAVPSADEVARSYPLGDIPAIATMGVQYWEQVGDVVRLLCTLLHSYDPTRRSRLFEMVRLDDESIWQQFCVQVMNKGDRVEKEARESPALNLDDVACAFTRFFDVFLTCRAVPAHEFFPLSDETKRRLTENRPRVGQFCVQIRVLTPYFQPAKGVSPSAPGKKIDIVELDSGEEEASVSSTEMGDGKEEDDDDDDDHIVLSSPSHRNWKKVRRDKEAQNLRDTHRARMEAQENRRQKLLKNLELSSTISRDQSRLIINETKEERHRLIYFNREIGLRIRDHQIEGVRFLWNQIIVPKKVRQGCLLAHTMGLGKTMQIITLLVAIAEASASPDKAVYSQIPPDLRESKTLILCPPGLVENWMDEFVCWTPQGLLGNYYDITATTPPSQRLSVVKEWAEGGGVLILGYHIFRKLLDDSRDNVRDLLEKSANIVIADEAHALKSRKAKIHCATANFSAKARIAMTGSPLANSIDEYHSMINWVAPNFLANHHEFTTVYAKPIKNGLYKDSTRSQRRQAIKLLRVLKETVAPKIHRATAATVKGELPPKREFILYVPLTPLQKHVYTLFLASMGRPQVLGGITNAFALWKLLSNLALVLAHPKIFKMRLDEMKNPATAKRTGTLPPDTLGDLLAAVSKRDIDDLQHSAKVVVLLAILDEARSVGDKVLVFSQSKLVLDYLENMFRQQQRRFSRLDGETAVGERQAMVKNFNTGQDEVYLISTTAGGIGLNIQGANRVVIMDFKWNPMHEQQAIGRAYRIGQTKPVFVYWLITGGTFETVLHKQAVFKTQLASRVVDRKNPQAWAEQLRNYMVEPQVIEQDRTVAKFLGRDHVLDALLARPQTANRICSVVSTDTFEEEEPEDKLSEEELKETRAMIQSKAMLYRSPAELAAAAAAAAAASAVPAANRIQVNGGAAVNALATTPGAPLSMMSGSAAVGPPPGVDPLPSPPPRPQPMVTQSSAPSQVPTPAQLPTTPAPIAVTHPQPPQPIGAQPPVPSIPPPPSSTPTGSPALLPVTLPSSHGEATFARSTESPGKRGLLGNATELVTALNSLVTTGKIPAMKEGRMTYLRIKTLVQDLRSKLRHPNSLPSKALWAHLRMLVETDLVFAKAIVFGRVPPEILVNMKYDKEKELLKQLHSEDCEHNKQNEETEKVGSPKGEATASGKANSVAGSNKTSASRSATPVERSRTTTDGARNSTPGEAKNPTSAIWTPQSQPPTLIRDKDPDLVREHLRRSMNRPRGQRTSSQSSRDSMALMEVMDRRRRKSQAATNTTNTSGLPSSQPNPSRPKVYGISSTQLHSPAVPVSGSASASASPSGHMEEVSRHLLAVEATRQQRQLRDPDFVQRRQESPRPPIIHSSAKPAPKPPTAPKPEAAGDNAHNPFVLD